MRRTQARVTALTTTASGRPAARLRAGPGAIATPGQVSLACRPGAGEALRRLLVPVEIHPDGFTSLQPEGVRWLPGDALDLLGPLGRGFAPPKRSRWLLMTLGLPLDTLLPLVHSGLQRGVEIAVWGEGVTPLPPQIEVLPHLEPGLAWAEYLALAVSLDGLQRLQIEAALAGVRQMAGRAEVLFLPPLICGLGVCGACAWGGRHAAHLACTDGPVFPLQELLA